MSVWVRELESIVMTHFVIKVSRLKWKPLWVKNYQLTQTVTLLITSMTRQYIGLPKHGKTPHCNKNVTINNKYCNKFCSLLLWPILKRVLFYLWGKNGKNDSWVIRKSFMIRFLFQCISSDAMVDQLFCFGWFYRSPNFRFQVLMHFCKEGSSSSNTSVSARYKLECEVCVHSHGKGCVWRKH